MPKRIWFAAAGAAALLGVGGVVLWRASLPEPKQISCRGIEPDNPLGNGVLMTPDEAERAFNPPLLRPQIDVASDETIDGLWARPSPGGQVYIEYESGVIVNVRPLHQPTRKIATSETADGIPGKLIELHGVDVFTVPPQRPCFGGNAVFNLGGANVAVINDPLGPFEDVGRVTESILETAPEVIAADQALDGTS